MMYSAEKPGTVPRSGPIEPPEWQREALCATDPDPDSWFAEPGSPMGLRAQLLCNECPVRALCRQQGELDHEQHGIWATDRNTPENYCTNGHFLTDTTYVNRPKKGRDPFMICIPCRAEQNKAYRQARKAA